MSIRRDVCSTLLLLGMSSLSYGEDSLKSSDQPECLVERTYSVVDLIAPKGTNTSQELINLITSRVAPDSWSNLSGSGVIDFFPRTGTLVVLQTSKVHEEVVALLDTVRSWKIFEVSVEVQAISLDEPRMNSLCSQWFDFYTGFSPGLPMIFLKDNEGKHLLREIEKSHKGQIFVLERHRSMKGENAMCILLPRSKTGHDTDIQLSFTFTVSSDWKRPALKLKMAGITDNGKKDWQVNVRDGGLLEHGRLYLLGGVSQRRQGFTTDFTPSSFHHLPDDSEKDVKRMKGTYLLIKPYIVVSPKAASDCGKTNGPTGKGS